MSIKFWLASKELGYRFLALLCAGIFILVMARVLYPLGSFVFLVALIVLYSFALVWLDFIPYEKEGRK